MNRTTTLLAAICLLLIGSLTFVACGGDDDDAESDVAATGDVQNDATEPSEEEPTDSNEATPDAVDSTEDSDDGGSGGGTIEDECDLLEKSEVEAAFNDSFPDPVPLELPETSLPGGGTASTGSCSFTSDMSINSVSYTYYTGPGYEEGIQSMADLACDGKESISDLGDQACWYDDQHVEIQLRSGVTFFDIFATTDGSSEEILLTLAEDAIGRMP